MDYLKQYTIPNQQELRQLQFKRQFKKEYPDWDDSLVLLTKLFDAHTGSKRLRVLDFGCGNGNWVLDELPQRIQTAIGVDVEKSATLKNRSVDKVIIGDIFSLKLHSASFDAVVSLWVFEHVHQPSKILKELHRLLKPGGVLAFVTPNTQSALILARRIFNLFARQLGTWLVSKIYGREPEDIFLTYYEANDQETIRQLAQQTGFYVQELRANFDPSYTAFEKVSYFITKLTAYFPGNFFKPHLVVVLKKL